ncbi:MAG: hypothetical protein JWM09_1132 [Francisellaceae bacterium]|nr:hypothetical protein [Francisellaceae bacterium]
MKSYKHHSLALFAIFSCFLWGSNYPATKWLSSDIPPFMMTACRLIVTVIMLMPFVKLPKNGLLKILAFSLTQYTLNSGFCCLGTSLTTGSIGALTIQLSIPIGLILSSICFKEKLTFRHLIGCLITFGGLAMLIGISEETVNPWGILILGLGGLSSALSNIQIKYLKGTNSLISVMALASIFAIPQLLFLSFLFEKNSIQAVINAPLTSYLLIFYILSSSLVANYIWNRLLQNNPVTAVMPYGLLVPLFGVLSSIMILNEPLNASIILGGAAIIMGVAILTIKFNYIGSLSLLNRKILGKFKSEDKKIDW